MNEPPESRPPNFELRAVIKAAGTTYEALARTVRCVAAEAGAELRTNRSAIAHWVAGAGPSDETAPYLAEALSRHLGRPVSLEEIGLADSFSHAALDWCADTLAALVNLGRGDLDVERRRALSAAAYSAAALAVPGSEWWAQMADRSASRSLAGQRRVGRRDMEAVRDMVAMFSRIDQRHGGGHGRSAVAQYLTTEVGRYLSGRFTDDDVRHEMFTAASELAHLSGWMAFDNGENAIAQRYFMTAVKLAAEADNPPMAGNILRGMAYQALELGHHRQAVGLATDAMEGKRYTQASPHERALLSAQLARGLAATGQTRASAAALGRAETDLAASESCGEEPGQMFVFGEADLSYQAGCALRDSGDLLGALREFRHSVRTRDARLYPRLQAVTLGHLGSIQARQGSVEEACATWSRALDAMDGVYSARTHRAATDMRRALSPVRGRGIPAVAELDARAAAYLTTSA